MDVYSITFAVQVTQNIDNDNGKVSLTFVLQFAPNCLGKLVIFLKERFSNKNLKISIKKYWQIKYFVTDYKERRIRITVQDLHEAVRKIYEFNNCGFCKVFDEEFSTFCNKFKRNTKRQIYSFSSEDVCGKLIFVGKCDECDIYNLRLLSEIKIQYVLGNSEYFSK